MSAKKAPRKKTPKTKKSATRKKSATKKKGGLSLLAQTAKTALARNAQKGRDALALIDRRVDQIADAFYDVALALQLLRRPEIYGALGCASFAELVETKTRLSRSLAFALVKLPEHLSREMAVAMQQTKALALLAYVDATPAPDDAEALAREDAVIAGKPVSKHTVKSLGDATRRARPTKARKNAGEADAHAIASRLEDRLEVAGKAEVRAIPLRRANAWWLRLELPITLAARITIGKSKSD